MDTPLQDLTREVWGLRAKRLITPLRAASLGREVFKRAFFEMGVCERYDPSADVRVAWMQAVLLAARLGLQHQFADTNTEATVEFMLEEN